MVDANYSAVSSFEYGTSLPASQVSNYSTTSVKVITTAGSSGTAVDATTVSVSIFR